MIYKTGWYREIGEVATQNQFAWNTGYQLLPNTSIGNLLGHKMRIEILMLGVKGPFLPMMPFPPLNFM